MTERKLEFFLGGHDLEMEEIGRIARSHRGVARVHDAGLGWGAAASSYRAGIEAAIRSGHVPVLIELENDVEYRVAESPLDPGRGEVVLIDHHNERSGNAEPTSLEQSLGLLGLTRDEFASDEWRWLELVGANDRGHVRALLALAPPATRSEMQRVRVEDRRAQGISIAEEDAGRQAAASAETVAGGRLTIVNLPHERTAPVADALDASLGGPGFENLLIVCPQSVHVFGAGQVVRLLADSFAPECWHGGALPAYGFWGSETVGGEDVRRTLEAVLKRNDGKETLAQSV